MKDKNIKKLILILPIIIYSLIASYIDSVSFVSIIVPISLMFYLFFKNIDLFKTKKGKIIYSLIFLVELLLLLYNAKYKNLPLTDMDWISFDNIVKNEVLIKGYSLISIAKNSMDLFVFFMSLLYMFFGHSINMMYFYIFPMSLIVFRYIYKTSLVISNNHNRSMLISFIVHLWPVSFLYSFALLREIPSQMIITFFLYNFVCYIKNDNKKNMILSIVFSLLAAMIHSGLIGILIVCVYVVLQKLFFKKIKIVNYPILLMAIIILLILTQTSLWKTVGVRFANINSINDFINALVKQNEEIVANSGYINYIPTSTIGIILFAPYRAILFAFSPFIWQIYDFRTLLSLLFDSLWQIVIWFLIIRSLKVNKNNEKNIYIIKSCLMIMIMTSFIFGFGVNNFGTALRHRSKVAPLMISIALLYGFYDGSKRKSNTKTKNIVYLRSTSIINDSRAYKEIMTYLKKYKVLALGWNRQNIDNIMISYKKKKATILMYNNKSEYGNGIKNLFKMIGFQYWMYRNLIKYRDTYDTIHACDLDTAIIGNIIANRYDKKLVYDIYDYYVESHNLGKISSLVEKVDINIMNNADEVILCTEQRKKQISKASPKNIKIIHNTPQINEYSIKKIDIKHIKVCYVGILQDDRLLLEICDAIAKHKNIELHIGGFGKYENEIERMSNIHSNIIYHGGMKYDDVLKLENDCDILFATYNPDILNHRFSAPNKVYEAMALGKVIIVCNDTGVDELVKKEQIGYAINYDAQEFINCINNITLESYEKMSENSRKVYQKKYSWDVMEKRLLGKK